MRSVISALFVSSLLVAAAAPAKAAFQIVYDVLGVIDNGGADDTGTATTLHCTNLSGSAVKVRVRAFTFGGGQAGESVTRNINPGNTATFSTHGTVAFSDGLSDMNTGVLSPGRIRVLAEKPSAIVCAADYVDAANGPPSFVVPRKMIRHPRADSGGEE